MNVRIMRKIEVTWKSIFAYLRLAMLQTRRLT